ncbi:hypothetical protein E8E15_001296 [Penicillium rubens]|nr:hypothetical protein E8E15_001296 [Penicillium rubens]
MSDIERFRLLKVIVDKSKIKVVCPKCLYPFPDTEPLYQHFQSEEGDVHQGLAQRRADFLTFRLSYEDAVGHEMDPELLRPHQPIFEVFNVIEQKITKIGNEAYKERYDLLLEVVRLSKVQVVCPQCLCPYPRPDVLKKEHFSQMDDDVHNGLALRKYDAVAFRASYQIAVGKPIPRDLLSWNQPVFSVEFVIDRMVSKHVAEANTIMIASGLSTTSCLNFLDLFEDFVLEALGLSPQRLQNFRQQYESLSNLLYSELLRKSGATEQVKQLIVDLQNSESDPFVCLAVESALKSYRDERCSILQLDFKFIIEPLRQVLFGAEPVTYILLQLQVLAIRFKKYYRGAHVNWSSHFDVQTEFLQEVCRKEPSHIAMSLSQDNQNLFGQLTDQALKDSDNDVVRNLFEGWDYLTSSVEECMATTAGVRNRIRQIAKSLHSSKNYHSLAAVVRGIESSGHAVDKRYRFIANQDGNYEVYRRMVKTQRHQVAIHYLFPIMREIQSRENRKQRTWKKLQEAGDPERQWKLRMELVNLEEDDIAGSVVLASKSSERL